MYKFEAKFAINLLNKIQSKKYTLFKSKAKFESKVLKSVEKIVVESKATDLN